jgi:hypothetical protein
MTMFPFMLGWTNLAKLTTQVTPAVQMAQASGKELVDSAFRRAVLYIGIPLAAVLLYCGLSVRLAPATRSKPSPPLTRPLVTREHNDLETPFRNPCLVSETNQNNSTQH